MNQMIATLPRTPAPGPVGHWALGSLPDFHRDIIGSIDAARVRYGDLVRFRLGPQLIYAACSPELAEEVLVKRSEVFPTFTERGLRRPGLYPLGGSGLLSNPDHAVVVCPPAPHTADVPPPQHRVDGHADRRGW